ncbi:MAG: hypothetical protein ACRC38_06980, partial [Plesiomonas sp.]
MKITPSLSQYQNVHINESESVSFRESSSKKIRERDVVIINPYCAGGGDEALAKKIANIALGEGCRRVTISSLDTRGDKTSNHKYQSYALQSEEPHHISQLNNPLFIIAPVGISAITDLAKHLTDICDEFKFSRKDIILIEEMDVLTRSDKKLINYAAMLKDIGFSDISMNRLGFGEGAIGYIPTDVKTINEIKKRFDGELIKLLDSYNVSLSSDNSYHLGYISTNCYFSGMQVFIINTLYETAHDERNAIFIMSLRLLDHRRIPELIEVMTSTLTEKNDEFDYSALFSNATITVINSDDGNVSHNVNFAGCGTKRINIVLTDKLPKNIYDDFLLLADTGMASGDQSLSEY